MKRKLNDQDIPEPVVSSSVTVHKEQDDVEPVTTPNTSSKTSTFLDLNLDSRLLQAISTQFQTPTPIQSKAIPVALTGKDILARARTGSGKTAAYALPVLDRILRTKSTNNTSSSTHLSALILVPTRELAAQVTKAIRSFTSQCGKLIRIENVARKEDDDAILRARLAQVPDVLVSTPSRANALVQSGILNLEGLMACVVDEADLVLSYGHEDDLKALVGVMPRGVQNILMSATLRPEVLQLKGLLCTGESPVIIEMDDKEEIARDLKQYVVKCGEDEKFLLIYAIFMLKLIKGKVIVFVADIDRCYRLKLFLEQFGIRSCVLNSELPANSRIHVVEEFNRNVYDIIIASDENEIVGSEDRQNKKKKRKSKKEDETDEATKEDEERVDEEVELGNNTRASKKRKRNERDAEYGISRGIDFKNVSCVLNFDLPISSISYTHRTGRTARAGNSGMALSFCIPSTLFRQHKPTSIKQCEHDEEVLGQIIKSQEEQGQKIEPYDFDMKRLDGFRYRMTDALRSVTGVAVRETRAKEIRQELLKSEKLKRHFEENPADLAALRHDDESHTIRTQQHLRHVPDYLIPGGAQSVMKKTASGVVGFNKIGQNRIRAARMKNKMKGGRSSKKTGKGDPLKSLSSKK